MEGFHGHEILVKAFSAFLHVQQQKFPLTMRKVGNPLNVTGLPKMTSQNLENKAACLYRHCDEWHVSFISTVSCGADPFASYPPYPPTIALPALLTFPLLSKSKMATTRRKKSKETLRPR